MKLLRLPEAWRRELFCLRLRPFSKEVLRIRFLITVAVLIAFSNWLGHFLLIRYPDQLTLDAFAKTVPVRLARACTIVRIGSSDYEHLFRAQSPLPPQQLSDAISRILTLHPAVLAVDLDTSAARFAKLAIPTTSIPIVWARDAADETTVTALPVLGNRSPDPRDWGFVLVPYDPDWTIRRHPREIHIGARSWPSFHWAITEAFCRTTPSDQGCAKVERLRHSPGDLSMPLYHYHVTFPVVELGDLMQPGAIDANNALQGRIVLLGGYYSPCDRFATPFGVRQAVELIGSAVEAELDPQHQADIEGFATIIIELVLAITISWIHYLFRPRYALVVTFIMLGVIFLEGTYVAFRFAGYRMGIIPFVVGLWIEQTFESAEGAHRHS
jgi:hypothetical protein